MTEHEMRFWAQDRIREQLQTAETHRSLRAAAAARPSASWWSRVTVLRRSWPANRVPVRP